MHMHIIMVAKEVIGLWSSIVSRQSSVVAHFRTPASSALVPQTR
jgi:hypothetical protein